MNCSTCLGVGCPKCGTFDGVTGRYDGRGKPDVSDKPGMKAHRVQPAGTGDRTDLYPFTSRLSDLAPHPDLPPDYPGLTDPDGAMVAFQVRCKRDEHGGPYLPAYLAGWFLAASRAPAPNGDLGQFRDSIRGGYADCVDRQSRRVQHQARPVECERQAVASDLLYAARGYDDAGDERLATIFRQRAARVMAGKHREEPK